MKLVTYRSQSRPAPRAGILHGEQIIDIATAFPPAPASLLALLQAEEQGLPWLQQAWSHRDPGQMPASAVLPLSQASLLAPLPRPPSLRDFYAFEQHVRAARFRRGLDVVPEWYQVPVFYFSNHQAIIGPEAVVRRPRLSRWLDFELEVAAIVGRAGRDIPLSEAASAIAGYTIMNDWSARDLQRQEMKVGLGPAKGKDFATSLGPWLVTPDELVDRQAGKGYDLAMIARRNGQEFSHGNWQSIYYSFAEMIARASADVMLYPGDVIGSGTVGGGCILEPGPEAAGGWLQPGEVIELEVERLGLLRNRVG